MKHPRSFGYHVFIFVLAQVAWLSLLGIWIYWYVSNYFIFSEVENKISPQIISAGQNIFILIGGLGLLVLVSVAMSLLFHRLIIQFNMTRLYDNFIANVTHELKSPLASIQLALETLDIHDLHRDKRNEFIRMMLKDAARLNHLINAILEIPALEQKKIAHDFSVYRIGPLIGELIDEAREQFLLSGSAISLHGDAPCQCVADCNALKIVVDNLIDNTIKYSTGPVRIDIAMQCGAQTFKLDYRDSGIGISAQDAKKVFEKFYRVHNSQSPNVKGTGLGLYWTREIILFHGGTITVSSRGRNKGACFHIELPIYQASKSKNRYLKNLLEIAQRRQRQKEVRE